MGQATLVRDESDAAIVRVSGFRKGYRRREVVSGVDLKIAPGEIHGLIGADGAGKSSLMKAIAGVLTYDAGEVDVFGVRVHSEASAERIKRRIGFMPQGLGLNLYPELSIEENVDFFAKLRLVPESELETRKKRLLTMTRLDRFRGRPMKNLSGGMKQKLGLVCTLIHEPDLLILDEPTTGVDPVSRRDFWAILAELLQERQMTALISTAYLDEASRFHRITLLDRGRVLTKGDPDAVIRQVPGSKVVVAVDPQIEAMTRLKSRFSVEAAGTKLEVFAENLSVDDAKEAVKKHLAGLQVTELEAAEAELEDVVLTLLRREQPADEHTKASIHFSAVDGNRALARSDDAVIHAHELTKQFGDFRAVDRASFHVAPGEIFGLLGANGAGKTTVIKMLTGILRPSAGEALLAGADTRFATQAVKQSIGYMSQAFSLYQDLTVLENIRLYAGIYGLGRRQTRDRLAWVLDVADLYAHQADLAGSLPLGLRQRLALGCALIHDPRILFLDEPTSGVDPIGRRQIWDLIFELSRQHEVAVLVTTHYMGEAEHCDRLALMHEGRVVSLASPDEMKADVQREAGRVLVLHTDRPLETLKHLQAAGHAGVSLFGKRVHLLAPDATAAADRIRAELRRAGIQLTNIQQRPISMENVFVYRILQLDKQREEAA